jgi:hypothetical protein
MHGLVWTLIDAPRLQRDVHVIDGGPGFAQCTATQAFAHEKPVTGHVADRKMAEVEITDRPATLRLRGLKLDALAKKGELIPEAIATLRVLQIAGQVPPLGLEMGVSAVVARKAPRPGPGGALPGFGCFFR